MKEVKHKVISVVIAIALIILVVVIAFGKQIKQSIANGDEINLNFFLALIYPDKYSYSKEMYDLNEYFQIFSPNDVSIILGDERLEDKGIYKDDVVYFKLDTVEKLFTDRFYFNETENNLLYTTASSVLKVDIDSDSHSYLNGELETSLPYDPSFIYEDTVYIALDYCKMFADFDYAYYPEPHRVEVINSFEPYTEAALKKDTEVRYQGGVKSAILTSVKEGDKVHILETLENWTKVRTVDGFAGYVENKVLGESYEASIPAVTGAYIPEEDYVFNTETDKVCLAWHQIYYADDGNNLNSLLPENKCVNVVSPTWFYINDEAGTFDNYSSAAYVTNAHNRGLKVWALVEDMTNEFDEYALFSSTENRRTLINGLVDAVTGVGADGINVDCEKIGSKTGSHFVQFLRELSIACHKNGLVLSADNYVQNQGNLYYDLHEQGIVCDYVVIMGYDEHWAGSEPGSVASIGFVEKGITSAIDTGVPVSKLINGLPFYTRIWCTEGTTGSSEAVGMDTVKEWLAVRGLTPTWNDECCQNYIRYEDGTAVYQVWIEDADSLDAKLSVMSNYGIAGAAGWKLGLENSSAWDTIGKYY